MELSYLNASVTLAGVVASVDPGAGRFAIQARSGDIIQVLVGDTAWYSVLTNLDQMSRDRVPDNDSPHGDNEVANSIDKYVKKDAYIFVQGIFQSHKEIAHLEARVVHLLHYDADKYLFEEPYWWLRQISLMTDRWLDMLFKAERSYEISDFSAFYKTNLNITGGPTNDNVQECATLARLIYGLSSAYLLTGAERYYLAAKAGVAYQREAFRMLTNDGNHCFWAYGRRREASGERLIVSSENPDDAGAIPLYEQIYALAGLAQYYRITQDWEVLEDIRRTVNTFQDYYLDTELRGYYSHIDPVTRTADSTALGDNQSRKNWNSIGDHIPAYLINLVLALDPVPEGQAKKELEEFLDTCRWILEETSDLIVEKFPDPSSLYVNERFDREWNPDHHWRWQQNRAIVGHNLKIAWNLTRCAFYFQYLDKYYRDRRDPSKADSYRQRAEKALVLARKLGRDMGEVGLDKVRGGIYDAVERETSADVTTRFAWGCTKDFWQQEQGILAYLILHGAEPGDREFLRLARESSAFWNLFFLDRDRQGVFFRTDENGFPIVQGSYGQKGGHSVSGYHAFELNFLAHIYTRSYVAATPPENRFVLYFKVSPNPYMDSLNVLPDFMPPGRVKIRTIRVDGRDFTDALAPENPDDFQIVIKNVDPPKNRPFEVLVEFEIAPA